MLSRDHLGADYMTLSTKDDAREKDSPVNVAADAQADGG